MLKKMFSNKNNLLAKDPITITEEYVFQVLLQNFDSQF